MARTKRHPPPPPSSPSAAVTHSPTASEFTVAPILRTPQNRNDDVDEGGAKKSSSSSNRVWCEEDEVAILTGVIEFKAEHGGVDPTVNKSGFHGFMKTKLKADVSRTQLMDKLRRLKNKYYDDRKACRGRYSGRMTWVWLT